MRSASLPVVAAVFAAGLVGCTYDIPDLASATGSHDGGGGHPGGTDASTDAASGGDGAGSDGGPLADGGAKPDAPVGPTVYSGLGDSSKWSFFDANLVTGGAETFGGGTFDGRYVYFAPNQGITSYSVVARFDTTAAAGFINQSSWSAFDTHTANASAQGFFGAVYDGSQYVYFTPSSMGMGIPDGVAARYDTKASFTSAAGWSTFDTQSLYMGSQGFAGEAFDGRYLYFVPIVKGTNAAPNGLVARYDTQAGFTTASAWSFLDVTMVDPNAHGFLGAVYDGRYVTFVPNFASIAIRYDTQQDFLTSAAWESFDTSGVAAQLAGFEGAVFDGHYLYFVPGVYQAMTGDTFLSGVVRFDTTHALADAGAWSRYDVANVDSARARGFSGGAFDGRYVYLVPDATSATSPSQFVYDGYIVRYDTTASFTASGSWEGYDLTGLSASAKGFLGAVFDGEYLYLVPAANGLVARFDAKKPGAMPALPQFHGSFL